MADIKQIVSDFKTTAFGVDEHKDGENKRRALFSGALVGMITGLLIGYNQKWNMFFSIAGGAVIGGAAAGIITPKD